VGRAGAAGVVDNAGLAARVRGRLLPGVRQPVGVAGADRGVGAAERDARRLERLHVLDRTSRLAIGYMGLKHHGEQSFVLRRQIRRQRLAGNRFGQGFQDREGLLRLAGFEEDLGQGLRVDDHTGVGRRRTGGLAGFERLRSQVERRLLLGVSL